MTFGVQISQLERKGVGNGQQATVKNRITKTGRQRGNKAMESADFTDSARFASRRANINAFPSQCGPGRRIRSAASQLRRGGFMVAAPGDITSRVVDKKMENVKCLKIDGENAFSCSILRAVKAWIFLASAFRGFAPPVTLLRPSWQDECAEEPPRDLKIAARYKKSATCCFSAACAASKSSIG